MHETGSNILFQVTPLYAWSLPFEVQVNQFVSRWRLQHAQPAANCDSQDSVTAGLAFLARRTSDSAWVSFSRAWTRASRQRRREKRGRAKSPIGQLLCLFVSSDLTDEGQASFLFGVCAFQPYFTFKAHDMIQIWTTLPRLPPNHTQAETEFMPFKQR